MTHVITTEDAIAGLVEAMDFDELKAWADVLGVSHDEECWLDDEWPYLETNLRVVVEQAACNIGHKP